MKKIFKNLVIAVLTWEARLTLARRKPKIIAITGSVGKTSTKDAIYSVMARHFRVRKSEKSFNSDFGVPLTVLGCPSAGGNPFYWIGNMVFGFLQLFFVSRYPQWLVMEVGAGKPGDIERFGRLLAPDAVVLTRLSEVPVHVEFFQSPEGVIKEKGFLARSLKDNGILFLNADDKDVMSMRDLRRECRLVTFGIEQPADFEASNLEINYAKKAQGVAPTGVMFKVNHKGSCVPISIKGALGRQHVYPILAALAFGESLGFNMVGMSESVSSYKTPPGRMRLIEGVKGATVVDDTYNSSPVAVSEALRTLGEIKTGGLGRGRKIAVLGDMLELGKYSLKAHEKAGKEVAAVADILVTVGLRARDIAEGALDYGMDEKNIFQFDKADEAGKPVEDLLSEGDVVLVKGSQAVRMEKIVEEVMAHPEDKEKLLVRQGKEWRKR